MRSDAQHNAVLLGGSLLPVAPWEQVYEATIGVAASRYGPFRSNVYLVSLRVFGGPRCYWKAGGSAVDAVASLGDSVAIVEADGWVDIPLRGGQRYISIIGDGSAAGQIVERQSDPWLTS